jgi:hypothetical protein
MLGHLDPPMKHLLRVLLLLLCTGMAMATEEPAFEVVEKSGDFELRRYAPMVVAETWVAGSMREASGKGFRLLADYIFGNNTARAGGNEKIRMTAPVTMEQASERIRMTAPVGIAPVGERWRVHFVMPAEYTLEALPAPNDPAVRLREVPAGHYAVIRFSGLVGAQKLAGKTAELLAWLDSKGIEPVGEAALARYNPPWTLPFMRRNEILVAYALASGNGD